MYVHGQGVPQDYAEAVKWYRKAADEDFAVAQGNLGTMYALGHGVPQDYAEAATWYRKAADEGFVMGQFSLGTMYAEGHGVPQDCVLAYMWFNLAALQGTFKDAVKARDNVASKMTAPQIAEAQKLARRALRSDLIDPTAGVPKCGLRRSQRACCNPTTSAARIATSFRVSTTAGLAPLGY
jgi:TPR repeat protein